MSPPRRAKLVTPVVPSPLDEALENLEAERRMTTAQKMKRQRERGRKLMHFKGAFDDGVPDGKGPNDPKEMNVYETLKGNDKHYD